MKVCVYLNIYVAVSKYSCKALLAIAVKEFTNLDYFCLYMMTLRKDVCMDTFVGICTCIDPSKGSSIKDVRKNIMFLTPSLVYFCPHVAYYLCPLADFRI